MIDKSFQIYGAQIIGNCFFESKKLKANIFAYAILQAKFFLSPKPRQKKLTHFPGSNFFKKIYRPPLVCDGRGLLELILKNNAARGHMMK